MTVYPWELNVFESSWIHDISSVEVNQSEVQIQDNIPSSTFFFMNSSPRKVSLDFKIQKTMQLITFMVLKQQFITSNEVFELCLNSILPRSRIFKSQRNSQK